MANTFGNSKATETSAWQSNKELNIAENSSVTDDVFDEKDEHGDTTWRPTDSPLESPTDEEFDEAEAKKRNKNIESETPGLTPDIAE